MISEAEGPNIDERLQEISSETFGHLAQKAKHYDVLSKKARNFLVSIAKQKRQGKKELSEKQLKWLKDILLELVDKEVVTKDSKDDDQEHCDNIFAALGICQ